MSRNFYYLANFFLVLAVIAGVIQSIIHISLGPELYVLQPFAHWYLGIRFISLISLLFLLKYFQYRRYVTAFWTGVILTILIFVQTMVAYVILVFGARELEVYNIFLIFLNLGISIIFALCLIFSNTRERINLRLAGALMFFINLVLGPVLIWALASKDVQIYLIFEKVSQWASCMATCNRYTGIAGMAIRTKT